MLKNITFTLLILISSISLNSNATPINVVDFTGENQGIENEFIFTKAGISLTVSAWTTNVKKNNKMGVDWAQVIGDFGVYKGRTGLGVKSSKNDGYDLDGGKSKKFKSDPDEGILLMFSEQVNFLGFVASDLSDNDDLNFSVVNFLSPGVIETTDIFMDEGSDQESDLFGVFPGIIGSAFMIWVDGKNDDVRIDDIGFTKISEPSTLFLLSIAFISVFFRVRT
jgi:hypothetical protein